MTNLEGKIRRIVQNKHKILRGLEFGHMKELCDRCDLLEEREKENNFGIKEVQKLIPMHIDDATTAIINLFKESLPDYVLGNDRRNNTWETGFNDCLEEILNKLEGNTNEEK